MVESQGHTSARRIAFVLTPVDFGGAERVSLTFLLHRQELNSTIAPFLLCRPWEKNIPFITALEQNGVSYAEIPTRKKPREQGRDPFRILRSAAMLHEKVRQERVDLLHTNGYFADCIGVVAARRLGLPIVSTCHGFISNTRKYRFNNALDIMAMRFMDRVIAVSEQIAEDLAARGITRNKITVIENAVTSTGNAAQAQLERQRFRNLYETAEDELLLGYVGRLSEEKGLRHLLAALGTLAHSRLPVRLLVLGDGPQGREMRQIAEKKGIADRVVFAGFQENVSAILPALDIFILPSLTEGTSMALLEAMACALPVIATAVGGTPKVITHQVNGLLVPAASPAELAAAVQDLHQDVALRQQLGKAAKATVQRDYGVRQWLERLEQTYEMVLTARQ